MGLAALPAAAAGWTEGAPIREARAFGGAAAYNEMVFVAGGAGVTGPTADFAAYDTIGDIWQALPSMPVGRQNFGMAAGGDGAIYVSGGYAGSESLEPSRDFWRYDIAKAVWVRMAQMPTGRARHGMAAVGGKLYVVGGAGPSAARVLVYDIASGAWSNAGADLPAARVDLGVVAQGARIFAIGGRILSGVTTQVHVLDTAKGGGWRAAPALPKARAEAAVGAVGGDIHVAGGRSNDPQQTYADHYIFEAAGNRWRSAAALPLPLLGASAAGAQNAFVVVGGSGGSGVFAAFTASDVVNIYKP